MKPGPRRSISQADIVGAAFGILERKGFAAVSVRGVAAALGLTPTALYTYFPSKNALLRAMVEELLSTVTSAAASGIDAGADAGTEVGTDAGDAADAPEAGSWRDRVHAHAASLRARLAEHAGAIVLVTSGPLDGRHALALNEALVAGFVADGLAHADAAQAAQAVRAYVLGVAALDATLRNTDDEPAASGAEPLWSDAAAFPLTAATAGVAHDGFAWGLDRLLDGLERRAA